MLRPYMPIEVVPTVARVRARWNRANGLQLGIIMAFASTVRRPIVAFQVLREVFAHLDGGLTQTPQLYGS
jgi:hypothetical protein